MELVSGSTCDSEECATVFLSSCVGGGDALKGHGRRRRTGTHGPRGPQPSPLAASPSLATRMPFPNRHAEVGDCPASRRETWELESEAGAGSPRPPSMVTCASGVLTRQSREAVPPSYPYGVTAGGPDNVTRTDL